LRIEVLRGHRIDLRSKEKIWFWRDTEKTSGAKKKSGFGGIQK